MEPFLIQTVAAGQWTLKKCGTYPIEVPKFMLTLFYHFIQIHERNGLSQKNDFLKKIFFFTILQEILGFKSR